VANAKIKKEELPKEDLAEEGEKIYDTAKA
jgi:hypothetical protein